MSASGMRSRPLRVDSTIWRKTAQEEPVGRSIKDPRYRSFKCSGSCGPTFIYSFDPRTPSAAPPHVTPRLVIPRPDGSDLPTPAIPEMAPSGRLLLEVSPDRAGRPVL